MPLVKLWNADHTIKKVAQASSLEEVLAQAKEKGICNAANAKVKYKYYFTKQKLSLM